MKYLGRFAVSLVLLSLLMCGCGKDGFKIEGNVLEFEKRSDVPFPTGTVCQVDQMAPDDVIVAVNGYPITKRVYDIMMALKAKSLANDPKRQGEAMEILKNYRMTYFKTFIAQRLMVDNALELGLVTTDDVRAHVENFVVEEARKQNRSIEQFLKAFKGQERLFFYEKGVSYAMAKVISEKIPPLVEVNKAFVSNVMEYVEQQNVLAAETNRLRKAEFAQLREEIVSGKRAFSAITNKLVHIPQDCIVVEDDGAWGEFAETDMDDAKVAAAVFALPVGGLTEIIEDDDGFTMAKVCKIIPPEKDAGGEIVAPERRVLSRIYVDKIPMTIQESEIAWTSNLKRQMQTQAINRYVLDLSTNGTNRIEYPHGRVLFK